MKLTASKMSQGALASVNSGKRFPRVGRVDVSALVGCIMVGVGGVGCVMVGAGRVDFGVGVARVGVGRVGVGVSMGEGTGSCKSGKDESRDDFELHIVFLLLL
jgi:hypothetical protein